MGKLREKLGTLFTFLGYSAGIAWTCMGVSFCISALEIEALSPASQLTSDRLTEASALLEHQKDRYAEIAGAENREVGYALSFKRLGSDHQVILDIINDKVLKDEAERELLAKLIAFGKGGIFHFWTQSELNDLQKRELIEQLKLIDIEGAETLYYRFIVRDEQGAKVQADASNIDSPEVYDLIKGMAEVNLEAKEAGKNSFERGVNAFLELAGGSGARLGYHHPKIMLPASQVMNKSLAGMRSEKIRAMAEEYGKPIPWLIMTSDVTHKETVDFFNAHLINNRYFGQVPKEWVRFIQQRVMPQMTDQGEYILEQKSKVVVGGFGHGDARDWVLKDPEIQNWLKEFGIENVVIMNVDNAFVPGELEFGCHILSEREINRRGIEHLSILVVEKTNPQEKVGLTVLLNGKDGFLEYNQIPPELTYFKYTYEIDHSRFVIYKSEKEKNQYQFIPQEEFGRRIRELGLSGEDMERWTMTHLASLEELLKELPEGEAIEWLGKEYTQQVLKELRNGGFLHLWLRLASTGTLIWSLESFMDPEHPLAKLPEVVARNKAIEGYDPERFRHQTKDSMNLKANKIEIMAFHGFLVGESKGARILVPRVGGFAPIKERTGVDTPQRAAMIYNLYDTHNLREKVDWHILGDSVIELSPAFAFSDGRYLPEKVGKGGFIDEKTQLYLSGKRTHIGNKFQLIASENGTQFILRVDDEYNPETQVNIGSNVKVTDKVSFHLKGKGEVIVEDNAVFDYPVSFILEDGETIRIEAGMIQKIKSMLEFEDRASDVVEMYKNIDVPQAFFIKKLMDSFLIVEPDFADLYKSARWVKDQIEKIEMSRKLEIAL